MKAQVPNLLTICNLCCGFMGCVLSLQGQVTAIWPWLLGALVFDFLDGTAARLLNASSPIGKELDSLADMVSFGVLPGMLWMAMLEGGWVYLALLTPAFSALRLAKFNLDTTQTESFRGLATPAHTIWVFTLVVSPLPQGWAEAAAVSGALMLVAPLRLMALKAKKWQWSLHWPKPAFLLACVGLWLLGGTRAAPFWLPIYIVFSQVEALLTNKTATA